MIQRIVSRFLRIAAPVVLTLSLVLVCVPSTFAASNVSSVPPGLVGPKSYYLALGDSLGFGFQPNLDYRHGYADDFFKDLQSHGVSHYVNMACSGETTGTMIAGGCPTALVIPRKYPYVSSQLQAAVDFLSDHRDQVSPVTLDIGVNEFLETFTFNGFTCAVNANAAMNILSLMDYNLTHIILPDLTAAMSSNGKMTGDLFLLNYYDPFANACPNFAPYLQLLNQHLAADARGFATIVDVATPFGGTATPNPFVCAYTWMCSNYTYALAIHANTTGYQVMANTIEQIAGY